MDISLGGAKSLVSSNKEMITAAGFVYGVSKADIDYAVANNNWNGKGIKQNIELIADSVLGRTLGITPWPEVAKFGQSFDLKKIVNYGSIFWVGAEIAKAVTNNKLVHDIAAIGQPFAAGYALGKPFDPEGSSASIGSSNYRSGNQPSASGQNPFQGMYA